MAEHFPQAFGSLYRRCGAATLKRLTSDETMIGQVESHRDKVGNIPHVLARGFFPRGNTNFRRLC
jgi:hypothetical protein